MLFFYIDLKSSMKNCKRQKTAKIFGHNVIYLTFILFLLVLCDSTDTECFEEHFSLDQFGCSPVLSDICIFELWWCNHIGELLICTSYLLGTTKIRSGGGVA